MRPLATTVDNKATDLPDRFYLNADLTDITDRKFTERARLKRVTWIAAPQRDP